MVLSLMADALGSRRRGAPRTWQHTITRSVSDRGAATVRSMLAPGYSIIPDCLVPMNPLGDGTVAAQVSRVRSTPSEDLVAELVADFGAMDPPRHWRSAMDRPREWLDSYAEALAETWEVTEPLWSRGRPLLDREVERIGTAAVRGGLDALLGTFHPRLSFSDGVLRFADPQPARYELGGRRLVLAPIPSGPRAFLANLDQEDEVWIAYPVPGVGNLWSMNADQAPKSDDALTLVLGPVRAALLRALDRPLTMTELARRAGCTPSTLSYHCDRLVATDLVERRRTGTAIRVSRTVRGSELVDLLLSSAPSQ